MYTCLPQNIASLLYGISFMVLTLAMTPIALLAMPPPGDDAPLLVITQPWGDPVVDVIAKAGGQPIGPVGTGFSWLASSEWPGFQERLKENGAIFILDGVALSALCGGTT